MDISLTNLQSLNKNKNVAYLWLHEHWKASEKYVDIKISLNNWEEWQWWVPYFYRRNWLFIEAAEDLVEYIESIVWCFSDEHIKSFLSEEANLWSDQLSWKKVTKPFFEKLLNLKWNSVKYDLPQNPNWARRIQDIKEMGYHLATNTKMKVQNKNENDTHVMLLPLPRWNVTGYEVMSPAFKKRAVKLLGSINIFELSSANKHGLLPDHKFPEIRWDHETRDENLDKMSDKEIKDKFQLLDNQRNQQKREACRKCFQENKRWKLFGLDFYYIWNEDWDTTIPKVGKSAENWCVGCWWYDIEKWRQALNKQSKKI